MDVKDIEIYSELVDNAVVRMPGRKQLGAVIQGDSLFLMHADLIDVLVSHKHEPYSELFYRILLLATGIEERLNHYIEVCEANNVALSFEIEYSVEDYKDLM